MLPKVNRLAKNKDFQVAFKKGKGFNEKFVFLKIVKNNFAFSRFGFVVSNRVSKKSTTRNKIKRQLSHIIYPNLARIKSGYDVIIGVRPEIKNKKYPEIEKAIKKILLISGLTDD